MWVFVVIYLVLIYRNWFLHTIYQNSFYRMNIWVSRFSCFSQNRLLFWMFVLRHRFRTWFLPSTEPWQTTLEGSFIARFSSSWVPSSTVLSGTLLFVHTIQWAQLQGKKFLNQRNLMVKQKQPKNKPRNQPIVITLLLNCITVSQVTFYHSTYVC